MDNCVSGSIFILLAFLSWIELFSYIKMTHIALGEQVVFLFVIDCTFVTQYIRQNKDFDDSISQKSQFVIIPPYLLTLSTDFLTNWILKQICTSLLWTFIDLLCMFLTKPGLLKHRQASMLILIYTVKACLLYSGW